jgi:two-component sensor histidine kinase
VDSTKPTFFDDWDVGFLGTLANVMGTALALHEAHQKNTEERAQRERDKALSNIVVRELQHRIKNNLQIIIAFLSLKVREGTPEIREKLDPVIGRVQAIALAHDLLSIGKQASRVDFSAYLRALCANIDPPRPDIKVEVEAEPVHIPIDRAVPAGLVVNELVTNSIKYAFGNAGGHIKVHFGMVSNSSEGCLSVQDDGRGMTSPPAKKGLGLTLVDGFAQQIQGRVEFEKVETGTRTVLCFPVIPGDDDRWSDRNLSDLTA